MQYHRETDNFSGEKLKCNNYNLKIETLTPVEEVKHNVRKSF